ncbi:MAG: UvrD-helicase domain-containing protein [Planctomycetota bacterium]|jgi:ATP-dependent helicase/nuclease subunit A
MNGRVKLTPAQQSAAHGRIGENLALLSGAGCGKTLVLAHRFTELLLASGGAENPLSRFVALTFTDKAALEMQQRVRLFLAQRAEAGRGADRRRLLGWLEELPAARISTIHSFCAGLLRAHAVEAGVDPNFAVCADQIVISALMDDAADEAVLAAVEADRQDALGLLARVPYEQLVGLVRQLVARRTQWRAEDYADPAATLERWRGAVAEASGRARESLASDGEARRRLAELASRRCSDADDKLLAVRDKLLKIMERLLSKPEAFNAEAFEELRQAKLGNVGRDKAWSGKGAAKAVRDELRELLETFAKYAGFAEEIGEPDEAASRALATITDLARQAEAIYAQAKRARGILDFEDLLARAHELLSGRPAVRRRLAEQIDQLLIDECQDTNAFQVELLNMLVRHDEGPQLPPGRLFVVGDKKQSIYRFRGAQVEVFDELCRRLGPKNRETLQRCFRMHPAGVAFVNELFARLMAEDYAPIRAHRRQAPPHPSVEILLAEDPKGRKIERADQASNLQAAATAQRISEMVTAGERLVWDESTRRWRAVRPGDIAILFARMTYSLAYERQLAARGVPYYVVAGTGFFRRQEVCDVLNALRAIDNPFDDVAFFGVLRSAMFGLDDGALMGIAEQIDAAYFADLLAGRREIRGLSRPRQESLSFAVKLLGALHRRKDAIGIDAIIERLLAATGYEATLLAQFNGRQMVGNVRRLIDLGRAASADGAAPAEFLTQISQQAIDQSRFEQAAVTGEAEDVVRLMTIHKAKGLEFPVVFVPDLNFTRRGVREKLLNRLDFGLTLNLPADEADQDEDTDSAQAPRSFQIAKSLEEADQRREDMRKLYVAATRHEDHLVFVGANWRAKNGTFTAGRSAKCFLGEMDQVLGIAAAADAGENIAYGDGFEAAVRKLPASRLSTGPRRKSRGRRLIEQASSAEDLAAAISRRAAPAAAKLLGAIPPAIGKVELAATALSQFEYCPMLYRWDHELRVPAAAARGALRRRSSLDAATMGTLFHRCMELLDFNRPQKAAALARRAAGEMAIEEAIDVEEIAAELDGMLSELKLRDLWAQLAAARRVFRELGFLLRVGAAELRGQIDVLYEDADGLWHIVDYKSDHVGREAVEPHARRYELQMLIYAAAAARHLARPPADVVLYFLRPAVEFRFDLTSESIAAAEARIETAAAELIAARRHAKFGRSESSACESCRYDKLCSARQ